MQDIMVDLETLGTVPGCTIISIGAVAFDEFGVADGGFHSIISAAQGAHGLRIDPNTEAWWREQSAEARKTLYAAMALDAPDLQDVLTQFNEWIFDNAGGAARVWGNGADFDNPILSVAYRATGVKQGWKPYNGRCYRTVKNQFPDIKLERTGTHHNALDDARSQAAHMVAICQQRGWRLA